MTERSNGGLAEAERQFAGEDKERSPDFERAAELIASVDQVGGFDEKLAILNAIRESADAQSLLEVSYDWRDFLDGVILDLPKDFLFDEQMDFVLSHEDGNAYDLIASIDRAESLEEKLHIINVIREDQAAQAILDVSYDWRDFIGVVGLDLPLAPRKVIEPVVTEDESIAEDVIRSLPDIPVPPPIVPVSEPIQSPVPRADAVPQPPRRRFGMSRRATGLAVAGTAAAVGVAAFGPRIVSTVERVGGAAIGSMRHAFNRAETGRHGLLKLENLVEPITESVRVAHDELIEDETYVHTGSVLTYPDILLRLDRLAKEVFGTDKRPAPALIDRYVKTSKLLLSGKALWPQATHFRIDEEDNLLTLKPVDWQENVDVKETVQADIVIVGGELEAICTAMEAADKGMHPALVYAVPLGGLSTDSAGNMRFFDGVTTAPTTSVQHKILHDALGMSTGNAWALPKGISEKLRIYLTSQYPQIRLVPTHSYDSLHVDCDGRTVKSLKTDEGIEVTAPHVIDMDPESRIAEKVGLPASAETPNMAYGLVFDVQGLGMDDFRRLAPAEQVSPQRMMELVGVSAEQVAGDPDLADHARSLAKWSKTKTSFSGDRIAWGFEGLGRAFDFYMRLQHYKEQDQQTKDALNGLNRIRNMDGFNIAFTDGEATLNSLNYNLPKALHQHSHNIQTDPELSAFRDIEIPRLQQFLELMSGKEGIHIRIPDQFYVRQAATSYQTLHSYTETDIRGHSSNLWMQYGLDIRGAVPRDQYDQAENTVYRTADRLGDAKWDINPANSTTSVSNLYLVNKAAMPPQFVGALRIIQNLIGTGVSVVDAIADGRMDGMQQQLSAERQKQGTPTANKTVRFENDNNLKTPQVVFGSSTVTIRLPQ